ncbi:Mature parasite-infected erythrocyte surface antigen (MESA) or PfEMP2 [Fulvivirga imtechensis AK7]|uniref:Mature parasite-infected erythrocyte surface antigen (MESA) or PfEMP2 n=1 Tax=Fulvivirga imtechensis AK7 TaxID=1237149 RepID=L8JRL1_9BACT|nr:DUF4366 domain-containing protein [Fulvivirga imtechensis]ELR70813.1 Mature parasite-infected erythrocyte surface antigen (MESA) or PfEMP2 [Fulvivirga imtechensis AK7]
MAKKSKKDELDDNEDINKDTNDDLNEADDNFGLPDVEYQPLDRDAEEEESVEEIEREEEVYSSVEEREEDVYANEHDDDYHTPVEEQHVYVPGSYKPPKDDSLVPKILALIFVVLLAGVGIWYFGFYRPDQKAQERAKIEQQRKEREEQQRLAAEQAERERQAAEQARLEEERRAEEEAEPKVGTIETISSRTGRYYVVIASAIDEDLAMDHAKKLSANGVSTTIIEPFGKSKFHRIAIENHDTWASAQNAANDLKGEYGEGVWVIRY